jgi:hypothetical protein
MTDTMSSEDTDYSSWDILYTTLKKNGTIFWDVTPCSLTEFYWIVWGKYCPHLQDRIVSQATSKNQEAGGNTFFRNVGKLIPE